MKENYRIEITPEYTWAEFVGWNWSVYYNDNGIDGGRVETRLNTDLAYWRWLAVRRAEKYAREHAAGLKPSPPKTDNLNYWYNPHLDEGWKVEP